MFIGKIEMGSKSPKITGQSRSYFSTQHLLSAALFSRLSFEIESNNGNRFKIESIIKHRAYVINAIIASVSCLEANINEFFSDVSDDKGVLIYNFLGEDTVKLISDMWRLEIPRTAKYKILDKYDIALTLARKTRMDQSNSIFQNVSILIKLRNALVHYEPEWVDSPTNEDFKEHSFEKSLKGKFELNPLVFKDQSFYPDRCLSHGCAEWACNSCIAFIDEFSNKMGITPKYEGMREQLITR